VDWHAVTAAASEESAGQRASRYAAFEVLRNGTRLDIRAQRPEDRAEMVDAFGRMGEESRYMRFFAPKRGLSEAEIARFMDADFIEHVVLVATLENAGAHRIAGAGRYFVIAPGTAEVAFMVGDAFQGLGIGTLLLRHLAAIARAAGLKTLVAEVLAGNTAMLRVFERAGLSLKTRREGSVVHLDMGLSPPQRR
jgi:RimJ/RimL family protein N-acetyltransferase